MPTIVEYNGVTLHNVQTRDWVQEVRYDESHTDAVFHVFHMRFEGILHAGNEGTTWVSAGQKFWDMRSQYADVQSRILKVRAPLVIKMTLSDGQTYEHFRCNPAPGEPAMGAWPATRDRDVDNGPKPKAFRILQIIGSKAMRVSFEIDCAKLVCGRGTYMGGGAPGALPNVLDNRWSVAEDMDENQFITRTINGKMRLSAAVAASGIDAKWLVVPWLEPGFRRAAIDFSEDKTGLECEYRVMDRQVHTAAPWPATKMSARHTQSTNDGLNMTSEVHVELEGPPYADKQLLLLRAIDIIDAKLSFAKIKKTYKTRYIPEQITITDHIGETNRVEATVRFLQTPEDTSTGVGTMFGSLRRDMGRPLWLPGVVGQPWPYDPAKSTPPAIYGYSPPKGRRKSGSLRPPIAALMLQCYLQQPCVDFHGIAKGDGAPSPGAPPAVTEYPKHKGKYTPEGSPDGYEPEEWSDSAKDALYTFSRSCSRYLLNQCRVQLPIAASPSSPPSPSSQSSPVPPDTSRVFSLALGQCRRTIDVDIERVGAWPETPPPDDTYTDGDLKGTLLAYWVEPHPPTLSADGVRRIYRVTAHYVYALNRPPRWSNVKPQPGQPPPLNEKVRVGVAPQTKFKKDGAETKFDPAVAFANKELGP